MSPLIRSLLLSVAALIGTVHAQQDPALTGTWTTKSRKVFTGPGFYNPVKEKFTEPSLPGISYSFTDDGHYEVAYYRAISNPIQPSCPQGVMQWQHGKYQKNANGSLTLTPFAVDGRQLVSDPCEYDKSLYTRFRQTELMKTYATSIDGFNGMKRLDLYKYDGSPMNPMWLAYDPPQMLPTITLNPTTATQTGGAQATSKSKRSLDEPEQFELPLNKRAIHQRAQSIDADRWWWIGLGITALGGVGYFCF